MKVNKRQKGYQLVELAVVLVVLGMVVTMGIEMYANKLNSAKPQLASYKEVTKDRQQSLLGYLFAHKRLPCPASQVGGFENCDLTDGYFPAAELDMLGAGVNEFGLPIHYALYSKPYSYRENEQGELEEIGGIENNVELQISLDRYRPFLATDSDNALISTAKLESHGNKNNMDFCQALRTGAKQSLDSRYLSVAGQPAAYVLYDGGMGDQNKSGEYFDGGLQSGSLQFTSPNRKLTASDDDRLAAVYFPELWEQLDCKSIVATGGHAQANVQIAATILEYAAKDFHKQMEILHEIAKADELSATAAFQSARSGVTGAVSSALISTAQAIFKTADEASSAAHRLPVFNWKQVDFSIGETISQTATSSIAFSLAAADQVDAYYTAYGDDGKDSFKHEECNDLNLSATEPGDRTYCSEIFVAWSKDHYESVQAKVVEFRKQAEKNDELGLYDY